MEYQELELGVNQKNEGKPLWRRVNFQIVGVTLAFVWIWVLTVCLMYNYYQLQMLRNHLNSTHLRVKELEMWQRHMCSLRHYNCPEIDNAATLNIHPDDYDWNNFPSMDDYHYEDMLTEHSERQKRSIPKQPKSDFNERLSKLSTTNTVVEVVSAEKPNPSSWQFDGNEQGEVTLHVTKSVERKPVTITSKPTESRLYRKDGEEDYVEEFIAPTDVTRRVDRNYQNQPQADDRIYFPRSSRRKPSTSHRMSESFEGSMNGVTMIKPTRRHLPAAHFNGDTTKYVLGYHTNFKGNGHLKHLEKTYVDWVPSGWMQAANMDETFHFQDGQLTINEHGLYFVYAQIYYLDEHDMNGYRVYRNAESILQCTTMTHSTNRIVKGNTCYTAGVEYLAEGDKVSVRDLSDERYSLFEKGKSFFGVIKISDVKVK